MPPPPPPPAARKCPAAVDHSRHKNTSGRASSVRRISGSIFKSFTERSGGCSSSSSFNASHDDTILGQDQLVAEGSRGGEEVAGGDDYSSDGLSPPRSVASLSIDQDGVPKRRVPSGRSRHLSAKGLLSSFTRKKSQKGIRACHPNHSSHPSSQLSDLIEEEGLRDLRPNSLHDHCLTETLGAMSVANVAEIQENDHSPSSEVVAGSCAAPSGHSIQDSSVSSHTSYNVYSDLDNDLDIKGSVPFAESNTMIVSLGECPSSSDLAKVAAVRAKEYIDECLSTDVVPVLDREKWDSIPQYSKSDLEVGQHLGKGTFSDAFEVICTVVEDEGGATLKSLGKDGENLGKLIEKRFRRSAVDEGAEQDFFLDGDDVGHVREAMGTMPDRDVDGVGEGRPVNNVIEEATNLDKEIDAMFGNIAPSNDEFEDIDKEIDAMFGNNSPTGTIGQPAQYISRQRHQERPQERHQARPKRGRRQTISLGSSICLGVQSRAPAKKQTRRIVLAMKCLRPQIRSNYEQFMIGVEDLVLETAMLSSFEHPNIIKLHGRAGGCASNTFRLSDGYFILLDRLEETLDDRIRRWRKSMDRRLPPTLDQIKCATCIADAMSYLHSKSIAFRDLKPANVGFDAGGVLKLFDFGFAIGVNEPSETSSTLSGVTEHSEGSHLLYDKCGTPRYMAPEVGLELGYGLSADIYSFGILLWEICELKKPFGKVKSAAEFHKTVFEKGARPKIRKLWPKILVSVATRCWSDSPSERPAMQEVKSLLTAHAAKLPLRHPCGVRNSFRMSSMFRMNSG